MKPNSLTKSVGIETNAVPLKKTTTKVNAKKIMPMVRKDLYSNAKQTMVQEYLSNARDSHRQAKKLDTPITVTLPTRLSPVLIIRDYGVSMSPELMEEVFNVMGNSTKDNNDDDIGGFGVGSKSALAYTDAFTIVTYYKGVQRLYVYDIGENIEGELSLYSENPTKEPDGVEIQIAIQEKDIEDIRRAVYRATLFWPTQPEIKGVINEEIPAFYKDVSKFQVLAKDNWRIFKASEINKYIEGGDYYNGGIVLLVGGIPYRLTNNFMHLENVQRVHKYLSQQSTLTIDVMIKDVDINPNRENLMASDASKDKVNDICSKVVGSIMERIAEEIAVSKTFPDFVLNHGKINKTLNERIENKVTLNGTEYTLDRNNNLQSPILAHAKVECFSLKDQRNDKQIVSREDVRHIYISKDGDTQLVYMDLEEGPNHTRERVRKYFDGDTNKRLYVLHLAKEVPETTLPNGTVQAGFKPDSKLFKKLLTDLEAKPMSSFAKPEVVKGEKAARASNKGKLCLHFLEAEEGRSRHSLVLRRNSEHFLPEEISTATKYLYIEMAEGGVPDKYDSSTLARTSKFLEAKGYTVIGVSSQVKSKLMGLEGLDLQSYDSFLGDFSKKLPLSNEEKLHLKKKSWGGLKKLAKLERFKNKIKDPTIVELMDFDDEIDTINVNVSIPSEILVHYKKEQEEITKEVEKMNKKIEKLEKEYPLVWEVDPWQADRLEKVNSELIIYINNKYENKK